MGIPNKVKRPKRGVPRIKRKRRMTRDNDTIWCLREMAEENGTRAREERKKGVSDKISEE